MERAESSAWSNGHKSLPREMLSLNEAQTVTGK